MHWRGVRKGVAIYFDTLFNNLLFVNICFGSAHLGYLCRQEQMLKIAKFVACYLESPHCLSRSRSHRRAFQKSRSLAPASLAFD